ncbi:hypothetical protein OEZ85_002792 [Tetradesmus obliquus]|uniref:EXPERA domain-containing protein n=1 Tax=Tetradesmus obliquus TaxID=3088 RepID=A0ABY8U1B1_TETOB|nr:hypothetical protein OEZ85_002792 [Tetradesmus obliquus]
MHLHDVLHYANPSIKLQLQLGGVSWSFETCWWVPLLFGLAGLILGLAMPLLDEAAAAAAQQGGQKQQQQRLLGAAANAPLDPAWPAVLLCISLFVAQYGLSGILEQPTLGQTLTLLPGTPIPTLDTLLFTYAMLHWLVLDKTPQGFGMAALTAVCGPAVEMLLINVLQLYHYSHPVVLGVPTWIPWVYFCGGPAVGNLGRRVWSHLKSSTQ